MPNTTIIAEFANTIDPNEMAHNDLYFIQLSGATYPGVAQYSNYLVELDTTLQIVCLDLVSDHYLSHIKPDFCICKNKAADQLPSKSAADQRLCFHYTDSVIPLLAKSEISLL